MQHISHESLSGPEAQAALSRSGFDVASDIEDFGFVQPGTSSGHAAGTIYAIPRVITQVSTQPTEEEPFGKAEHFEFDPLTGVAVSLGRQSFIAGKTIEGSELDHYRTFVGRLEDPARVDYSTTTFGNRNTVHSGTRVELSEFGPNVEIASDCTVTSSFIGRIEDAELWADGLRPQTRIGQGNLAIRSTVLPGTIAGDAVRLVGSVVSGTFGNNTEIENSNATGITTDPDVKIMRSTAIATVLRRGSTVIRTHLGPNSLVGEGVNLNNVRAQASNTFGVGGVYRDSTVGRNSHFQPGATVYFGDIGDGVRAADHIFVDGMGSGKRLRIGDYAHLGRRAKILGSSVLYDGCHEADDDTGVRIGPDAELADTTVWTAVRIGRGVIASEGTLIGMGATISDGVRIGFGGSPIAIGAGAYVGLGAHVGGDVLPREIIGHGAVIAPWTHNDPNS
jgi:NDP-sugar pyrophosphorylase family protein